MIYKQSLKGSSFLDVRHPTPMVCNSLASSTTVNRFQGNVFALNNKSISWRQYDRLVLFFFLLQIRCKSKRLATSNNFANLHSSLTMNNIVLIWTMNIYREVVVPLWRKSGVKVGLFLLIQFTAIFPSVILINSPQ